MAIRFDNTADSIQRTSGLPSFDSNYTVLLWFYMLAHPGDGNSGCLFVLDDQTDDVDEFILNGVGATSTRLSILTLSGGTPSISNGSTAIALNTWYCAALVRAANNSRIGYLATVGASLAQEFNHTESLSGRTAPSNMSMGSAAGLLADLANVRIGPVKIWTTNRSLAELQQEMNAVRPIFTDNLHLWSPCFPGATERARDYSGNGRNWTENGTLTDEDPPPIGWGVAPLIYSHVAAATSLPIWRPARRLNHLLVR